MPATDATAPAAGVVNVLSVLRRYRLRDFPKAFNDDALHVVGVPHQDVARTLHALKLLGVIEADGTPTEAFQQIQDSESGDAYAQILGAVVREAYAPVFEDVDPTTADAADLRRAFRQFEPQEDRERMLTLFQGLLAEAGLGGEGSQLIPAAMGGALRQRQIIGDVGKPKDN